MRVFKYPLAMVDTQTVRMPYGATILSAQIQGSSGLQMWALVDETKTAMEIRSIVIVGTGNPVPELGAFIDTFQMQDGSLVFHVFEGR